MIETDDKERKRLMDVETRARESQGSSDDAIYKMVAKAISGHHADGGVVVDVGCGRGNLLGFVGDRFDRYIGVDVLHY